MDELPKKLENIKEDFFTFIMDHPIEKAIHSDVLEKTFGVSGSEIRELVRYWSNMRTPIGNTIRIDEHKTEKKYFWAKNREELIPTLEDLYSREVKIRGRRLNLDKIYPFRMNMQDELPFEELCTKKD